MSLSAELFDDPMRRGHGVRVTWTNDLLTKHLEMEIMERAVNRISHYVARQILRSRWPEIRDRMKSPETLAKIQETIMKELMR